MKERLAEEQVKEMSKAELEMEFWKNFYFARDVVSMFEIASDADEGFETLTDGEGGHLLTEAREKMRVIELLAKEIKKDYPDRCSRPYPG